MSASVVVILVLAVGTYAFRLVGPALHGRVVLPARVRELLAAGRWCCWPRCWRPAP